MLELHLAQECSASQIASKILEDLSSAVSGLFLTLQGSLDVAASLNESMAFATFRAPVAVM